MFLTQATQEVQAASDADRRTPELPQGIQASLVDDRGGRVQLACATQACGVVLESVLASITSASRQTLVLTVMERVE